MTPDVLEHWLFKSPRMDVPKILWDKWGHGEVTVAELRLYVIWAWTYSDRPHLALPLAHWRTMFRACGFCVNGRPTTPPDNVRLYRAASRADRTNWSWTPNPDLAAYYQWLTPGRAIWTCVAPASALLARHQPRVENLRPLVDFSYRTSVRVLHQSPQHDEYVIDTNGLEIVQL